MRSVHACTAPPAVSRPPSLADFAAVPVPHTSAVRKSRCPIAQRFIRQIVKQNPRITTFTRATHPYRIEKSFPSLARSTNEVLDPGARGISIVPERQSPPNDCIEGSDSAREAGSANREGQQQYGTSAKLSRAYWRKTRSSDATRLALGFSCAYARCQDWT